MPDFLSDVGDAISDGLDAINDGCKKANDVLTDITETVVCAPDTLADMVAASTLGQYWCVFWNLEVDKVYLCPRFPLHGL